MSETSRTEPGARRQPPRSSSYGRGGLLDIDPRHWLLIAGGVLAPFASAYYNDFDEISGRLLEQRVEMLTIEVSELKQSVGELTAYIQQGTADRYYRAEADRAHERITTQIEDLDTRVRVIEAMSRRREVP